jgi:TonB family protein
MRIISLFVFYFLSLSFLLAQNDTIYKINEVDITPKPIGGMDAFVKFFKKNAPYPQKLKDTQKGGIVLLSFIVTKDGTVKDLQVFKGGPSDSQADILSLRTINQFGKWIPGQKGGVPVSVEVPISVIFKINNFSVTPQIEPSVPIRQKSSSIPEDVLYIIDEKVADKTMMEKIKPEDIENINVLKGEPATALYGEKGKAGVIVITTKKK